MGVGFEEPSPDALPLDVVSEGLDEGVELSVGVPDAVELDEEETVGVGVVAVGDGDVATGVPDGDGDPVPVGVGLPTVGLGVLDGVAAGQVAVAVAE